MLNLYTLIFIGYLAGRYLSINKEAIARILIYICTPIVIFAGSASIDIKAENLSLPILFFSICCLISYLFLKIGKKIYQDTTKNLLAFTAGTGNTGYFGLPIIITLLGQEAFEIAIMLIIGFVIYENTYGYYQAAKGHFTAKQSIQKMLKLPAIYGFILGLTLNFLNRDITIFTELINHTKSVYTVLGMMIIGVGLKNFSLKEIDYKLISLTTISKFIIWPVVALLIMSLNIYSSEINKIILIISIVPLASNTVSYAAELNLSTEKASTIVVISTFVSTIFLFLITPYLNLL